MAYGFKNILLICILTFFIPVLAFATVPINVIPNPKLTQPFSSDIIDIVKKNINLSSTANIYKARVQVIYQQNKPDYLLVYMLSAKNYSLTITKINLDKSLKVVSVTPNYHLQKDDLQQQPGINKTDYPCPNEAISFVSGTPADDIPTAKEVIENVTRQAAVNGYNSQQLLGTEATIKNYISVLNCPNLKAFFNVGHGNDSGILLWDGFLSSQVFQGELKAKLAGRAVVLFNSCEVMNDPLKSTIIEDANAQKYVGGVTTLWIGPSERASQCFWDEAFKYQEMTPVLKYCNQKHDPEDVFGIDGHGADVLSLPQTR